MSRVMVRVAALVAFLTTRPVAEVDDLRDFFPVTVSEILVPMMVAIVAVTAVTLAFQMSNHRLFFPFPSFLYLFPERQRSHAC